jgi:phytoene/squalene synthetase
MNSLREFNCVWRRLPHIDFSINSRGASMARTASTRTRAPRGTKTVAEAFFTAINEIPEPQRADVTKAALTMIRDRLKDARDKAKLARDKYKKAGKKAAGPKAAGQPKAAAKSASKAPVTAAKKGPKKVVAKGTRKVPRPEAPAMTAADEQTPEAATE